MSTLLLAISSEWISAFSSAAVALAAVVTLFLNKRQFVIVSYDNDKAKGDTKVQNHDSGKEDGKRKKPWFSLLNLNIFRLPQK